MSTEKRTAGAGRPGDDDDPDLECGICSELLTDAHQTRCCGGLGCRACLDKALESASCPFCREPHGPGETYPDVRMERRAANTVRGCSHAGCEYRGKRDELKLHAKECTKRPAAEQVAEVKAQLTMAQARVAELEAEAAASKAEVATLKAEVQRLSQRTFSMPRRFLQCMAHVDNDAMHDAMLSGALGMVPWFKFMGLNCEVVVVEEDYLPLTFTFSTTRTTQRRDFEIKYEVEVGYDAISVRAWSTANLGRKETHQVVLVNRRAVFMSAAVDIEIPQRAMVASPIVWLYTGDVGAYLYDCAYDSQTAFAFGPV